MHSLDSFQMYAHDYTQRLIDEAAHEALLASLPHHRSPRSLLDPTLTRGYLAAALRAVASRLDPQSLAPGDRRVGIARPR